MLGIQKCICNAGIKDGKCVPSLPCSPLYLSCSLSSAGQGPGGCRPRAGGHAKGEEVAGAERCVWLVSGGSQLRAVSGELAVVHPARLQDAGPLREGARAFRSCCRRCGIDMPTPTDQKGSEAL